jgi:3-phosphoshikimate 1-carboxyvinyltransferase
MSLFETHPAARLRGTLTVPGDKSISHRAVLFNAIARGRAEIDNFLTGADCLSTIACVSALGVTIERDGDRVQIESPGLFGLREPADVLDCGNSGTTLRLLSGLLAGRPFFSVLTGDASLRSRPQRRTSAPLRALGAQIDGRNDADRAPLAIRGGGLRGGHYELTIASAQVKSALLLAGLSAAAPLTLSGRLDSRDHTERMLRAMGITLTESAGTLTITPVSADTLPQPLSLTVPGDPSSAAFWWVAAALHPDAELTTVNICLNPTRTGALDVLRAMGAEVTIHNERLAGSEPVGDVTVRSSRLRGCEISGALIPRLIDEIPVLALAAACADGPTLIRDAQELRAKETDRIATVVDGLRALGAAAEPTADGMQIAGGARLHAAALASSHDHRLAMTWGIAGLAADGPVTIADADAADVSYPTFFDDLLRIRA